MASVTNKMPHEALGLGGTGFEGLEPSAFLAMAQRLRDALDQRDDVVRRCRERYDRSRNDPRVLPEMRVEIARAFLQAAYMADHVYEDRLNEAAEEYQESVERGSARA